PDFPVDLGASWIHDSEGNPLVPLAEEAGLQVRPSDREAVWVMQGGRPWTDAQYERGGGVTERLDRELLRSSLEDSVADVLARASDGLSPGDRRLLEIWASAGIAADFAGPLKDLAAAELDKAGEFSGPDLLVANGYGRLADHLAKDRKIVLDFQVEKISLVGPKVTVEGPKGKLEADACVVTLPLGVLKSGSVAFAPPLPPTHLAAIESIGFGLLNKCILRFESRFWPAEAEGFFNLPPAGLDWLDWVDLTTPTGRPGLMGLIGADPAEAMEARQDAVESAYDALRQMFGNGIPRPVASQITRWRSDPLARGSYSFPKLGGGSEMRKALAEPVGERLIFAGEALSVLDYGTVHGAFLSGIQAAETLAGLAR
ncbi:MAG: FAD-dependent oxidoreductase, partial [Fimbriimonadaceae bacterium]|nr:FAD-dependent oxidoreductase [Fimbriimonadaceae bacterium]